MPVKDTTRTEPHEQSAVASTASNAAKVLKAALVLTAPICAPLLSASSFASGTGSSASHNSEVARALPLAADFLVGTAMIAWVLVALMWLIVYLFSSGHHRLPPLHESLAIPALALYLAAFVPILPYVMLGPWGGAS